MCCMHKVEEERNSFMIPILNVYARCDIGHAFGPPLVSTFVDLRLIPHASETLGLGLKLVPLLAMSVSHVSGLSLAEKQNFFCAGVDWLQVTLATVRTDNYNWSEPERAPHKRYMCARSVYIYLWYNRHPQYRSIYIVQGPHAKFYAVKFAS